MAPRERARAASDRLSSHCSAALLPGLTHSPAATRHTLRSAPLHSSINPSLAATALLRECHLDDPWRLVPLYLPLPLVDCSAAAMSDLTKSAREHALEEKKKKLEELRQLRAQRMQQQSLDESASLRAAAAAAAATTQQPQQGHQPRQSAEDILSSVSSLIAAPASSTAPSSSPKQTAAAASSSAAAASSSSASAPASARRAHLGASAPTRMDIAAGESKIQYEQSTQTELKRKQAEAEAAAAIAGSSSSAASTATTTTGTSTAAIWDSIDADERDEIIHERDDLRAREVGLLSRIRELTLASETRAQAQEEQAEQALHAELDPREAEKILASEEFGSFLERSSKVLERLLGFEAGRGGGGGGGGGGTKGSGAAGILSSLADSSFDYMADYGASDESESDASRRSKNGGLDQRLTPSMVFANDSASSASPSTAFARTTNRPVTSINWSPKYPELLLASYASSQTSMDSEGAERGGADNSWMEPDGRSDARTHAQQRIDQFALLESFSVSVAHSLFLSV